MRRRNASSEGHLKSGARVTNRRKGAFDEVSSCENASKVQPGSLVELARWIAKHQRGEIGRQMCKAAGWSGTQDDQSGFGRVILHGTTMYIDGGPNPLFRLIRPEPRPAKISFTSWCRSASTRMASAAMAIVTSTRKRTRFIPNSILEHFETCALPKANTACRALNGLANNPLDVGAKMRRMWG
jgi:hypothetical protein